MAVVVTAALVLGLVAPARAADSSPSLIARIVVGTAPSAVAVNSRTDRIYVATRGVSGGAGALKVVTGANNSVDRTIPVGVGPSDVVVNEVTNTIYVIHNGESTYKVIDGATDAVTATILVPGTGPIAGALDAARSRLYITHNNQLAIFNTITNTLLGEVDFLARGLPGAILGVAVDTSTNTVYVGRQLTTGNGFASVVDGTDFVVIANIPVGGWPENIAVNESTGRVYVSNAGSGTVSVIDRTSNTVIATIALSASPTQAAGLAVDVARRRLYVANESESKLAVIDTTADANSFVAQIQVGGTFPQDVAVNTTTDQVYVPNFSTGDLSVIGTVSDTTPPAITAISETPDPFSPNADGVDDTTLIRYTLSEPAFVQLEIFASNESSVRLLVSQQQSAGLNSVTWDGRIGVAPGPYTTAPAGTYYYEIRARDAAGNTGTATGTTTVAAPAPAPAGTVLILGTTVSGGASSLEAQAAIAKGLAVEVVDAAGWRAKTAAQFDAYRALIIGDPTCGTDRAQLAAADETRAIWAPVVTGNVLLIGTDPVYHQVRSGAKKLIDQGVAFAVDDATKTGAYITLSCWYHGTAPSTAVSLLGGFGDFTVRGVAGADEDAHIVASHPALSSLTDVDLANWSDSVHEAFESWPTSFQVLAIVRRTDGIYTATDGSKGHPYILARGEAVRPITGLRLEPLTATKTVGETHTLTATLTVSGAPAAGKSISFAVSGANTASGTATTNGSGIATFSYAGTNAGNDTVTSTHTDGSTTVSSAAQVTWQPVPIGLRGFARCGEVTLPGATVELLSGRVVVATMTANGDGSYFFAGVAPGATYTVRITGSIVVPTPGTEIGVEQFFTCGTAATVGADGRGTAPSGISIPNRLNHTWTTAYDVTQGGPAVPFSKTITDYLFTEGQSTWFRFPVRPGQQVTVNVTGLPADYTVTLYKDIRALYLAQQALASALDPLANVAIIDASVAPDALSPDALSPDALSPDALSPDALSPDALSPDALSPDALSPDALSPDALSPDALSPDALSPDALSPDALSPDALSPDVYASAQTAALIGVSANIGLSPEKIARNTWENFGYFYVRVRGYNGVFAPSAPFTLTVTTIDRACAGVTLPTFPVIATAGFAGMKTVILTNSARLGPDVGLGAKLGTLAGHPRVQGVVVDLAGAAGGAYAAWDAPGAQVCPAAANAIAKGIRALVLSYRAQYPTVEHVVLVGGDRVIPFFRTPDQSGLGNERDYVPPVRDDTASQASLKLGYVLTQDPYGTLTPISRFDHELYIPELGVGRLVETPAQITSVIDAFLASGGVIAPQRALVTGYDFLSDAAAVIGQDLVAGGVLTDTSLVQPVGDGPTAPTAWTADQLRAKLLAGPRADIVALNGHFSANRALAADYATRLSSEEIAALTNGRFRNTLILSTGCHSGYNIVDGHATPLTQPMDFPQAFALQGATLIGGTGYQYGDTDFIKYSELIHTSFVRELRYGTVAVSVGTALANAKRAYVSQLANLRGIDEKAIAVATLYGLPMTAVDLPVQGLTRPGAPLAGGTTPVGGSATLSAAVWSPTYTLVRNDVTLTALGGTATSTATYYDINGNVAVSPGTPVLPLLTQDVVRPGAAARGVVLLSASYADEAGVRPFTDVATTEVRAAHAQYTAEVFTPVRPFTLNHFAGTTLVTTPFQFRSAGATGLGTARTITSPQYKIYYSSRTDAPGILAASPVVYAVHLIPVTGGVRVDVIAGAAESVGIAELYATYTGESGALYGSWTSLGLTEDLSTRVANGAGFVSTYRGTVATADAAALRVLVQAAAGNGLVSWATNNGAYYRVVTETATTLTPKTATSLTLSAPANATYLGTALLSATLTGGGTPLALRTVAFRSGDTRIDVRTNASGVATAALPIRSVPGVATVSVGFAEDATHLASGADATIQIAPAPTSFVAATLAPIRLGSGAVVATLRVGGQDLNEQPVTISGGGRTVASFSDGYGRVRFDTADGFPSGDYTITLTFDGNDRYLASAPLQLRAIVYDPRGSVRGGGWLGTGSARTTWALEVKYKKAATTPTGLVEVRLPDGRRLRATSFDWLAVSGGTATLEGSATLDGVAGHRFRIVATDLDPRPKRDDHDAKDKANGKDDDHDHDEDRDEDEKDARGKKSRDVLEIRVWNASTTPDAPLFRAAGVLGGGNLTVR